MKKTKPEIGEGVRLGDGSKIRVLTRQEARRQQIRVAQGDPSLVEDLKREKADPEDAEIHLHRQMIELVLKAIRLGENELEFLFWVHEFYVAAHIHEDDLEKWQQYALAHAEERIDLFKSMVAGLISANPQHDWSASA